MAFAIFVGGLGLGAFLAEVANPLLFCETGSRGLPQISHQGLPLNPPDARGAIRERR